MSTNEQNKVDINYSVLRFIYIEAMKDATRWKAFNGKRSWLWLNEDVYKHLIEKLGSFLDIILSGKYKDENMQNDYDEAFCTLCSEICNHETALSFGNAQKLVNIFVKFFYVLSYKNIGIDASSFRCCHCPMDRRLLEKVWKDKNKLPEELQKKMGKRDDFIIRWGEEKFRDENDKPAPSDVYVTFQNAVTILAKQEGISRIEYDYKIWNNP